MILRMVVIESYDHANLSCGIHLPHVFDLVYASAQTAGQASGENGAAF